MPLVCVSHSTFTPSSAYLCHRAVGKGLDEEINFTRRSGDSLHAVQLH